MRDLSGVEEGTRKCQTMTRGTARHVSLFGIRGTLAWVFQGSVLGKKLTRTKEKDPDKPEEKLRALNTGDQKGNPLAHFWGAWVPLETAGKWTDNFCFLPKQF